MPFHASPLRHAAVPFRLSVLVSVIGFQYSAQAEPVRPLQAFPSLFGQAVALQQGLSADFARVQICVETGRPEINPQEFVFDVAIAHAMWLTAGGITDDGIWERFELVPQENCDATNRAHSSVVLIVDAAKVEGEERLSEGFTPAEARCTRQGCNASLGLTMQVGSSAILTGRDPEGRLEHLTITRPGVARLSPFVSWSSLRSSLASNSALSAPERSASVARYDAGKEAFFASSQLSLRRETLQGLLMGLEPAREAGVRGRRDAAFDTLVGDFFASDETQLQRTYTPEVDAFPTLLRAVGFQLGQVDVNLGSGSTRAPLFLTDGELAAAQSNFRAIETSLARQRTGSR